MKVSFTLFITVFLSIPALAEETWEACLDKVNFTLSANSFTKTSRFSKSGCKFNVAELGGAGLKYEFSVCDPQIHLSKFPSIESTSPVKIYAGSSACPKPMFGADFNLPPGQKESAEFAEERKRIQQIVKTVQSAIAPNATLKDADKAGDPQDLSPETEIACGLLLINDYLERCIALEETAR